METNKKNNEDEKIKIIEISSDDVKNKKIEVISGEKYKIVVEIDDFEFSM